MTQLHAVSVRRDNPMVRLCLAALSMLTAAAGPAGAEEAIGARGGRGLIPDDAAVALVIENDAFATGDDRNYTSGIQASFLVSYEDAPDWLKWMGRTPARIAGLNPQSFGFALGHTIFTPEDISAFPAPPDQHPYAGWAYAQLSLFATRQANRLDQLDLTLGLVGPGAGGDWIQREFHELINGVEPRGWDAQLRDELAFSVSYERRYRGLAERPVGQTYFDLVPSFGVSLGTLATEARAGVTARLGDGLGNDFGPPRIRPALAGGGLNENVPGLRGYVFIGLQARAVARNLFLDGNSFQESARVSRLPLVGDLQVGAVLQQGGAQLSYTFVARTEEFESQGEVQKFAALTLARRW